LNINLTILEKYDIIKPSKAKEIDENV